MGIDLAKKLIQYGKEHEAKLINPAMFMRHFEGLGLPGIYDHAWDSFLSRPWYTRIWIIQESLLNSNMLMLCGRREISWELFTQLIAVIGKALYPQDAGLVPPSERQVGAMCQMARLRTTHKQGGMSLLTLLASCRDLDCSDPRDRVFALSSLVKDCDITVDYSKSTVRVFTEVAAALLHRGPAVLRFAGINRTPLVPSWVPDWSVPAAQTPVLMCRIFSACGDTKPVLEQVNLNTGTLCVPGRVYDSIAHVTDTLHRGFITARMSRYAWTRDQQLRLMKLGSYPRGGSYYEALWRTLISDLNAEIRDHTNAPAYLAQAFEVHVLPYRVRAKREAVMWMANRDEKGRLRPPETDPAVIAAWEYDQNLANRCHNNEDDVVNSLCGSSGVVEECFGGEYRDSVLRAANLYRRLCTTTTGYIGMAPEETSIGDVVVLFPGAKVPFVLRRRGIGLEFFLIGDCYVHGLMNGEAFNLESGGIETITLL